HLLPVRPGLRSQLQRQEGQVSGAGRYRAPAPVASAAASFAPIVAVSRPGRANKASRGMACGPPLAFRSKGFWGLFIPHPLCCNFFSRPFPLHSPPIAFASLFAYELALPVLLDCRYHVL